MPTLQFKGKNMFHTLDEVPELHYFNRKAKGVSDKGSPRTPDASHLMPENLRLTPENMIIEGDNLLALKALLPQFAVKIKCIYIDSPCT